MSHARGEKDVAESNGFDPNNLFRYTSGRWLIDEKFQLEQRFVKFNVEELCSRAASIFSPQRKCVRIVKREGNFNKALILTMDDGNEVVAKIPCRNAGMPSLTTASEVATLNFLRTRTSIHVPEVYAWSPDPANPVGAEYIIMEKIRGVSLAERWETMSTLQRYRVIDRVVEMEKGLKDIKFPAYGRLYLQDSAPHGCHHHSFAPQLDPNGLFCIGPSCSRAVLHTSFKDMSPSDAGPWTSLSEFSLSFPGRELAAVADSKQDVQNQVNHFSESQSMDEYKDLLEKASQVLPILSHDPRVVESAGSVIWHPDLHLGNIFVSHNDPTIIEGIFDWQSAQAAPLLIQARFPDFLRPPKDYNSGTEMPSLPDNFDALDPDEKDKATRENALASQSKYYEMSCLAYNKSVYDAMKLDRRLWEPFTCCQLFSMTSSNSGCVGP